MKTKKWIKPWIHTEFGFDVSVTGRVVPTRELERPVAWKLINAKWRLTYDQVDFLRRYLRLGVHAFRQRFGDEVEIGWATEKDIRLATCVHMYSGEPCEPAKFYDLYKKLETPAGGEIEGVWVLLK